MKISRILFAIVIFSVTAAAGYAQVNQDELQQNLPQVTFINYEGPHARIDTREEIRQIGVGVGQQIASGERGQAPTLAGMTEERRRTYSYKLEAGASNRYFIIHCVSGPEDSKIDSDIFGLGVDAGVDHVRNLRTIIQGYLQTAYEYSQRDASLLAEYITIYNAVYRGNWDYFSNRYKSQVISNLAREKAGLSIRYDEWPGRTLILVPLGQGGISAIDTSTISDRRVVEELRREDDRGVPQRQGMVDLKEREAEQAEQRASVQREAIREEERGIAQERAQTAQERQDIAQERQRTQEDQQAGVITEEQARQTQEELDQREQAVDQQDQALDQREEAVEDRRQEAQRFEDFAEQKTNEAQQERRDIARDQQAAIVEQTSDAAFFGVTIEKVDPTAMGRIVRLSATGRELRRSPMDSVHARTVTAIGGKILAVAGENRGNGAVRLVEINQNTLEMAKQGNDDILTGSLIWVNANDLYAITVDLSNNSCYLGRFDVNLALQAKSAVTVHTNASIVIQQGRLLTQRDNGSALLLNPTDLTEIR